MAVSHHKPQVCHLLSQYAFPGFCETLGIIWDHHSLVNLHIRKMTVIYSCLQLR